MAKPCKPPKKWIRNASDQLAASQGAMWDRERGEHFINTVQNHFRLYEGTNFAGKLVELMPYQVEFFMRLFCWVVWSDFYGRYVRRFRRASLWVPKKNGKSPTGAMVGNYLTTADGEVGGKTFAVAKDGKQARIVHDHAVKMVEQSSDLLADCKITLNPERRITHLPSLSWFGVLSADNIEGQEGLNGNAIIDEGHVVVERLARVLKFMGASREEPIELMLSTAGDNKAGWGGKRWDYGQRVNKGEVRDTEFLHVCYAAPQDATDAQLLRPRMWRKANPALGHILDEERFAQELETARSGSMQEWSDFKKYRFNIWQTSTSPWLSMSAWDECPTQGELQPELPTYGGLDLSSKMDFTAWMLLQKQGDEWIARGHYWISEAQAQRHRSDGRPIDEWQRDGWLTICPGERVDYDHIIDRVASDSRQFDLKAIGHDPWNAEAPRQVLEDEHGMTMIEVPQNYRGMSDASKSLEAAVAARELNHGGDPVLSWMAGIVTTMADNHDNIKPVKPDRKKLRAIDGIVSLIMALGEAETTDDDASLNYYEDHELEIG